MKDEVGHNGCISHKVMRGSTIRAAAVSLLFLLCVSCLSGGGGGGGSGETTSSTDQVALAAKTDSLTAQAGSDQTIVQGEYVALDGSGSTGNAPLTYSWTVVDSPSGSNSGLNESNVTNPTFTPTLPGDYTIRLVVTDVHGQASDPDEVIIRVLSISESTKVTLAWDAGEQGVEGYRVYYGTSSGNYRYVKDAGNATGYTVSGLAEGVRYYFAVTAYAGAEESDFSNEVSFISPTQGG